MRAGILQALVLAAGCAMLLSVSGIGQEPEKPVFAAPVRIKAGEAFLGQGRYYPSPVLHDIDGDKHLDIVIGDLFGRVTVARRVPAEDGLRVKAETALKNRNGKPLKFHNW